MEGTGAPPAEAAAPQLGLAVALGLVALAFLPIVDGGYCFGNLLGEGFQVGFVLLPLAAALAWGGCRQRPAWAVVAVALCAASVAALPWWVQGGRELWFRLLCMPAAWIVVWVLLRQAAERERWLWPVVVGSAVATALYAWFLWLGSEQLGYQLTGTFGLHNAYAGYLLLAWPVAALCSLRAQATLARWLYGAASVYLLATFVLTYSRAAWLVLALQLLALALWGLWWRSGARRRLQRALLWLGGAIAVSLMLMLALPSVRDALGRIVEWQGYSMQGRLRYWQAALEIFRDHPWGIGLGNFAFVYPQYQLDYVYYSVDPHSWPLQLVCELGVAGVVVLLALLVGAVWWGRRLWRSTSGSAQAVLLSVAVGGSLAHAAVDFDYTFAATTALLGVLLAYGTHLATAAQAAQSPAAGPGPGGGAWTRWVAAVTVALLLVSVLAGEALTLERYQLDHVRDNPTMPEGLKRDLLSQALRYNPFNHRTHYQLAAILAHAGPLQDEAAAREHVERSLDLNPRYANGWALKGLLAEEPQAGDRALERSLELDPYNYPEHYFYYASLTADDATKRERLLLGLERIPAHHPIRPDHVRPTWHELNPLWAEWYFELARLTDEPEEKELYRRHGASFQAYWERVLTERGAQ